MAMTSITTYIQCAQISRGFTCLPPTHRCAHTQTHQSCVWEARQIHTHCCEWKWKRVTCCACKSCCSAVECTGGEASLWACLSVQLLVTSGICIFKKNIHFSSPLSSLIHEHSESWNFKGDWLAEASLAQFGIQIPATLCLLEPWLCWHCTAS